MPKIENPLGPGFERRLRATLDRVQPPHNAPRYMFAAPGATLRTVLLRAAPAVAVGVVGLLLTAYAATGSPNPVTWTQHAASAITSITHPEPSPTAEPSSAPAREPSPAQAPAESKSESSSEASLEPEPPEGTKSTERLDD